MRKPPHLVVRKTTFARLASVVILLAISVLVSEAGPYSTYGHIVVDDASRLNATPVAEVWSIPSSPADAETQLQKLLALAEARDLSVSIAGAKHSMGGHTIAPDGIVIDMTPFNALELDASRQILNAGSGARWQDIVPYLDTRGHSVAIMQSNNDFTVGGSISVNCHGWQPNSPPIASTVDSFRIMLADGTVHTCSREENRELFGLALGGYGLFGVILNVDLRVAPNTRYSAGVEIVDTSKYVERFHEKVGPHTGMVYGRLCVVPGEESFLREAILVVFQEEDGDVPALEPLGKARLRRFVYRLQIGRAWGKRLRWKLESSASMKQDGQVYSRNQLINEEAAVFQERGARRTDILHEYFVPEELFDAFLDRVRAIVPRHRVDLLNVTVRDVHEDTDTVLRYADTDMFAFVMLFNQKRTKDADEEMRRLTVELIDAASDCGGRYYLPYRLHATPQQFRIAYPEAKEFFTLKEQFDPGHRFQNQFYLRYGRSISEK